MELQKFYYDNKIVKQFILATIVWGVVGILVGIIIALQLAFPVLNLDLDFLTYGRLRPLHTNAIIFAFVGNAIFAGVYYSLQKLLKTRMASDFLSKFNFWGWQLIIVSAAITLPLGLTTGKEYAELEWPIDIAIALVWVAFGVNMIATIMKRRVKHIYAAIWWYIATFVGVAILHVVNSFELPIALFKSYSVFAGAQDAIVQWWYGHNAVAFFLTTPYLGLMYYYLPKAANRPIYSYKLSIIHFWSLIFLYMWAGPHHLLYQALPNWAQALGVTFSIMLIAPSWGGMMNGLLTLRGAWDKVRDSASLKFMVVGLTAYGMATFEGPMMSLKSVNAISHFTDWTVAHTHIAGMGWNGGMTFGILYWLVPKLFKTKLFSEKLANKHFWLATLGLLLYAIPLYWSAISQWLMWQEYNETGALANDFMETVTSIVPMYMIRALGGVIYLLGFILMVVNLVKTMSLAKANFTNNDPAEAAALENKQSRSAAGERIHRWLERKPAKFIILALIALVIGGAVEVIPMSFVESNTPHLIKDGKEVIKPYSALELEGRDVYIANGCYNCHSQMVRPFRWETGRYGEYSKIGEFIYDHPFQWGSRRTGPDLARAGIVGGPMYKSESWHFNHFMNAKSQTQGSIMPNYPWFATRMVDAEMTVSKMKAMKTLGVPYSDEEIANAVNDMKTQGQNIVDKIPTEVLKQHNIEKLEPTSQMVAIIAYLHKLGRDISPAPAPVVKKTEKPASDTLVIRVLNTPEDLEAGKKIYDGKCFECHGTEGDGIAGKYPAFTDEEWLHGSGPTEVFNVIKYGVPEAEMQAFGEVYSDKEIVQVLTYILKTFGGK